MRISFSVGKFSYLNRESRKRTNTCEPWMPHERKSIMGGVRCPRVGIINTDLPTSHAVIALCYSSLTWIIFIVVPFYLVRQLKKAPPSICRRTCKIRPTPIRFLQSGSKYRFLKPDLQTWDPASPIEHRRIVSLFHAVVPGVGRFAVVTFAKIFAECYVPSSYL